MNFLIVDSTTWTITILGWVIVFAALLFLVGIFLTVPKIVHWVIRRNLKEKGKTGVTDDQLEISGETNAVIAAALYMYLNENHDDESNVITIKQVRKRYSPWSSKLYGMNNMGFPK